MSELIKAFSENIWFPKVRKYGQVTIDADIRKRLEIRDDEEVCMIVIPMKQLKESLPPEEILELMSPG